MTRVAALGYAAADEESAWTAAPPGNGGSTDKYIWTQTLKECTVSFFVPKDTRCVAARRHVCPVLR